MAYTFSDASKREWPGPCVNGWREVKALLAEYKDWPRPALEQLMTHGHTNMLAALSVECNSLIKKTTNKDIIDTLTKLAAIARNADEVVFLEH